MSDESEAIPLDKLVRTFTRLRDQRKVKMDEMEKEIEKIETKMDTVKAAIMEQMKASGVNSVKTEYGTAYRTTRTTYSTSNWDEFYKFVLEHREPGLLERRIHQGNMKEFLEQHPELLPPGLNANSEYTVTVRKS